MCGGLAALQGFSIQLFIPEARLSCHWCYLYVQTQPISSSWRHRGWAQRASIIIFNTPTLDGHLEGRQGSAERRNHNQDPTHLPASLPSQSLIWLQRRLQTAAALWRSGAASRHLAADHLLFGGFLFLFFIIIVIIIPLSVYKLIVNVRKPVLLWTTLYQCHPVTFLWRQLWRGWHLTPCWQRHREADLKKTIDAFSRTPLPSLSLRYIFSEIYLVTRPPDTIGYPAQQGNEWRALPEPAKYPGFHNVLVFPPVWEWIVGTVLNIKHRT